ncbi:uncharacterized protein LOC110263538 [Arachis ipaensis]|uniref:uncharacterized protein LOC110263538 n=1 Tax=Arachis ipaensis TaxID=130454 RepID=UPI000A2B8F44|nr:uncharacterized protein LOC110263538 [Arachis ipaensis]
MLLIRSYFFIFFFNLTIPFSSQSCGFISFRDNPNRRIFNLFEESYHDFKERFFKVERVDGTRPFFMTMEDEKRFNLYWNFNVFSAKIQLQGINSSKFASIQMLLELCNHQSLNLRTILADEHTAQNFVVDMVGCLEAIIAMKRRSASSEANIVTNTSSGDRISSFTIMSNVPLPLKYDTGAGPEFHNVNNLAPINSPKKKKQMKRKSHIEETGTPLPTSFGCILKKEFQSLEFIDEYLLIDMTKSCLAKLSLEKTMPQVQRMLFRSAASIRYGEKDVSNY